MMWSVLSAKHRAKKLDLCPPIGTFASAIQRTSEGITVRSSNSSNSPVWKEETKLEYLANNHINHVERKVPKYE